MTLIQDDVFFNKLGLVITDEQHRFGVEQRRVLREKGENPNTLFMTATPIPRTLAITVFGEMDVSIIDEMPAGRKVIETYWAKPNMLDRVLGMVEKQLQEGRQAVCDLSVNRRNQINWMCKMRLMFMHNSALFWQSFFGRFNAWSPT